MPLFSSLAVTMLGLAVGSFLGAYTFRKVRKITILYGRSFCPHCKAKIAWFDNFPLLSFLLLRGSCRACGKKISWRYPAIEAVTALIFVVLFRQFDFTSFIYFAPIATILIAIFVIDLEHKIIPDELVFLGIFWVLSFLLIWFPSAIYKQFLVGLTAAVFFLLIHLATGGRGMGLGDVKFVILGGLLLGWPQVTVWLFAAFTLGATLGLILILLKRAKFGREIPFGPFLSGALVLTILYGDRILNWYATFL